MMDSWKTERDIREIEGPAVIDPPRQQTTEEKVQYMRGLKRFVAGRRV
jgi:hypothetical protein